MVLLAVAMCKVMQLAMNSEDVVRPRESCDNEHAVHTHVCVGSYAYMFLPSDVIILHDTVTEHTAILS